MFVGISIGFPAVVNFAEVLRGPSPTGEPPARGRRRLGFARSKLDEFGDIHAEAPCSNEPWYAYGRFRVSSGQLQIAELRVFPGPDRAGLTKASVNWPEIGAGDAWRPIDDLTAQTIRSVPMRHLRSIALECVEKYGIGPLSDAERASVSQRPGRAGRSDSHYALWAALYVEKVGARAPISELAREHGLRREQVRDLVQQARKRGLVTPGRNATLTEKARSILNDLDNVDRLPHPGPGSHAIFHVAPFGAVHPPAK